MLGTQCYLYFIGLCWIVGLLAFEAAGVESQELSSTIKDRPRGSVSWTVAMDGTLGQLAANEKRSEQHELADIKQRVEQQEDEQRQGESSCFQFVKNEFRGSNFGLNHPNPRLLISDQWGYKKQYKYWRLFWALYFLAWSIYDWTNNSLESERPATWLIYLTNWSFLLLTVSAVVRAVVVVVMDRDNELADGFTPWYLKGTWLLYEIVSPASFLVTILYFALLFKGSLSVISAVTHLFNSVYVIADLYVTAMPVRLLHVVYILAYGSLYIVFTAIYWAAGGVNAGGYNYVYQTMDWNKPAAAAPTAVGTLIVGVPLVHFILWSLYVGRLMLYRHRRCCR